MYSVDSSISELAVARPGIERVWQYRAFGLAIRSALPLPEFPAASECDGRCDAFVAYGDGSYWIDAVRDQDSFWSILPGEARLWFKGVGGFLVRGGAEIVVSPEPEADESLLRLYVEGMMMACLLQQRGFFVLHASVVQMADYAVAFLGHVGAGKSSMAAALHARGHAVVTDDNAAVDLAAPEPAVTPAFPSLKIYPDIATSLGYESSSLRVMHASQPKQSRSVSLAFPESPLPLRRIYILTREDNVNGMVRLSSTESMIELIRNSAPTRWRQPGDARHLMQCGRLGKLIPAWRVRSFDTLAQLPELARLIEQHVSRSV
jgi:hypothetical protein